MDLKTRKDKIALSVVIACKNAEKTIPIQLNALSQQSWDRPWEIIISDNGSTDNTYQVINKYKNKIKNLWIVDASEKAGAGYARNKGIKESSGEAIALCDADDEVAPGWLAAMGNALLKHDFVVCRTDIEKLNPSWLIRSRKNPQATGIQKYTYPPYLPHAGGGTIGFKKFVFEKLGGFDESFKNLQDTDFCWRAQLEGIRLHFVSDAIVHIRFRDDVKGIFSQARNYGEYNVKIYKKYLPQGMPKIPKHESIRNLKRFILNFYAYLRTNNDSLENKAQLAWQAGYRWGRIKGSIKYKVFAV